MPFGRENRAKGYGNIAQLLALNRKTNRAGPHSIRPANAPFAALATEWPSMSRTVSVSKTAPIGATLVLAVLLAGCAGADYQPVVDMRGHSAAGYDADLAQCQYTARRVRNNENTAEDAGVGALGGAALGAVGGAIGGNAGLGAGVGALAGLVGTGAYEEAKTENREETIVKNCMRARGYNVLD
jgi:outer membrane lipoprotein SlyB